ncbi:uncharacterized protein LOC126928576 isoform X18 [Bombus affinis]|uniref:uncharacterized protein LOC126928576 isoform X17 n=1 Tax=Bombus affinis TaxID=309941 RepID=UPI0021B81D72|nr:uncharacterized protein LOC126928576 isoform X17 [Bombus affinis]XP_050600183.1 uncharacterized protein LOC126928576 isoform X18 [Bombus affinis]
MAFVTDTSGMCRSRGCLALLRLHFVCPVIALLMSVNRTRLYRIMDTDMSGAVEKRNRGKRRPFVPPVVEVVDTNACGKVRFPEEIPDGVLEAYLFLFYFPSYPRILIISIYMNN